MKFGLGLTVVRVRDKDQGEGYKGGIKHEIVELGIKNQS